MSDPTIPFAQFAPPVRPQSTLRRQISAATRLPEEDAVARLLPQAEIDPALAQEIAATTRQLVTALRSKGQRGGVEALVKEYSLSSHEGVALMCLAEALLRIPDRETRDALIRDKIARGDWRAHLGEGNSLFVNATTWGLMVTGKLAASHAEDGLAAALTRLIARAGEPVIRRGIDMAMQMMGEQFVTGETIGEALHRARRLEARGFAYSYDMLGEAATTQADADRYYADYENAIHAIGKAADGRGLYAGPGISIKLSALHPRYSRAQAARVMGELLPRVHSLAMLARGYGIGLNIDAEESERLELSLDILESLALADDLAGWNGLGFVVQAYGKRCPMVIDWLVDLARRSGRRLMVRLVKGAYWDSEIKRAQVEGQNGFPVFTRKVHTDVSYIACARKLLAAREAVFPQFATHNAQTLATIYHMAGPDFTVGDYEFQCLHGMGEALYEEVVGFEKLDRPCRIYAPVGTHETLLAYLVRRLLENGANSSFVHRIWDEQVSVGELAQDPVTAARAIVPVGAAHEAIALPRDLFGTRRNSQGIDLANEAVLEDLSQHLRESVAQDWSAAPSLAGLTDHREMMPVRNPADRRDVVGHVAFALDSDVRHATRAAQDALPAWYARPAVERAGLLEVAADRLEQQMPRLLGLIVREAGKSITNAVAEVREAVDFLRYYADQARQSLDASHQPLGPVACISPWNFPLAIFTGQIAAALAAGNTVLAKPAEETPLIAAEAVRILHSAGIPADVLQLLPGDGTIGAALVSSPDIAGVLFTGSTEVARLIQAQLASRSIDRLVPLVAETGGQNAMIVDSSALAEQVTADVIASAFDSAGQRCSALRILCLQEDIADRQLAMLKGALAELGIGNPDRLSVDVGPVITAEARDAIESHVDRMRQVGCAIHRAPLAEAAKHGTFVAPTIIEIEDIAQIGREVFGPVLHVLRYRREEMGALVEAVNATGYGLTFGLHTRLDDTVEHVTSMAAAGNVYVNRNVIGAVVGVQPFGGRGLSGTGPKAGGPLYLGRLVQAMPQVEIGGARMEDAACRSFAAWLESQGEASTAAMVRRAAQSQMNGLACQLPGPVGERNLYALHPRGEVLLVPSSEQGMAVQIGTALAAGNRASVVWKGGRPGSYDGLPAEVASRIAWLDKIPAMSRFAAVLVEPRAEGLGEIARQLAAMAGPIPIAQVAGSDGHYRPDWLVEEVSASINTTAAGGNASLMAMV
ncbi:trifunctional transcriptional regulator/proline dehydrogenase/L-glutamate gamma-semialdehyde dehydrogenase [Novosphingobium sp. TH158]|uniref:trifunctional transcriptional regulator/proline dehydrogenase/L-glutamate gamma-semialdehyde dehydrogenase n=1 Tax=Novosphingobium sp. TH158 TaxID=2067455 RepID=UPI000C7E1848|nr:trifunctional transcriptional regulator/proline dehydrogenase/L-glutamate gamma-semialdehyde dehydrogenase [Novosphingobium sp. TH158]PLK25633.1 trifunctional transcriptional regulator/proline dehydrogenase/L-glutamate gamma-semialdehyde dehydrogenase [Novosphingobium sp. TH158]